jgi:outer membrane immunogenic protein
MTKLMTTLLLLLSPTLAMAQDFSGLYGGVSYGDATGAIDFPVDDIYDIEGRVAGAFIGYNVQSGALVYGGELAFQPGDIPLVVYSGTYLDRLVDLKGRLGYAMGPALIYGVLGYSGNRLYAGSDSTTGGGVAFGLGVDYRAGDRFFVGAEYLRRKMHNDPSAFVQEAYPDVSTFTLRIGMQF